MLVVCDKCGAANCVDCVPQLGGYSAAELKDYSYFCVNCSTKGGEKNKKGKVFWVCYLTLPKSMFPDSNRFVGALQR